MTISSDPVTDSGYATACAQLAALAEAVSGRLPAGAVVPLRELAAAGRLDARACQAALAAVRLSAPIASLAARSAAQALVTLAQRRPDLPASCQRAGWSLLARICLLRREGRAANEALERAAQFAGPGELNTAERGLIGSLAAIASCRYADARRLLEASRAEYRRHGDATGQADAALELSQLLSDVGRFPEALALAEEAAGLAADDPWRVCRARLQSLDVRYYNTRFPEATAGYVALAGECQAAGWNMDYAHARVMQGLIATQQGNLAAAAGHLQAATAVYQAEGAGYYIGVCRRALAMAWRRGGHFADAAAEAQSALATFRDLDHQPGVGRCHQALGLIYQDWNRYDVALAEYDAALAILDRAGVRIDPMAIRINQAEIQAERGYAHAALACYEQALQDCLALRAQNGAAHCLFNMAMLHSRLGSYAEAVALYRRARRHFSKLGVTLEAQLCAARQAGLLDLLGQHKPARRLLAGARRYFTAGHHELPLAFCELILGEMDARDARPRRALAHFDTALSYFAFHGHGLDAAVCRLYMGETQLAAGHAAAAVPLLGDACQAFVPDLPEQAARAEHALGRACAALGQAGAAARHHQAAVAHVTHARRGMVTESQVGRFVASHEAIYGDALAASLAADDPGGALAVAEAAKGQVLASLLQQRDVSHAAFASQPGEVRALWEELWQTGRQLETLRSRWHTGQEPRQGPRQEPRQAGEAQAAPGSRGMVATSDALNRPPGPAAGQLAALSARQDELFERLRHSLAGFDLLDATTTVSSDGLRLMAGQALGPGWGALSYYRPAEDRLLIFWITANDLRVWQRPLSPLTRARLNEACSPAAQQREAVYADRLHGARQGAPPGPALMRSLGSLLIPDEVQAALDPDRPLLISPHGQLHYLPFHALRVAGDQPLVEQAVISYTPTLQVWGLLARRAETSGATGEWRRALVLAISEFGTRAPALEHAEAEARAVTSQLQRSGVETAQFVGRQARLGQLQAWNEKGALGDFDIFHLATHALFESGHPLLSRILLHDSALTVPDIFRLRLNARLVTLSACQTALSALYPGDELLGLREALLFAGARSLLVSLWHVDDTSTEILMGEFYRLLLAGQAPALALAQAQRKLLAAGASPYHWAPFVFIGV